MGCTLATRTGFGLDRERGKVGTASSYAAARRLVSETGYPVAPAEVGDCGSVVDADGQDAFGVAVLI
jgi:hypothetical protein